MGACFWPSNSVLILVTVCLCWLWRVLCYSNGMPRARGIVGSVL